MNDPSYTISKIAQQPEWLSLESAKQQIRVRHSFEDEFIADCILASVDEAEGYLGIFINHRDVLAEMDAFPKELSVDFAPVLDGAFSVSYFAAGVEAPLEGAYYLVEKYGKKPVFQLKADYSLPAIDPRVDAVKFSYVSGLSLSEFPSAVKKAMQLIVAEMYEYRTDRSEIMSTRAKSLLRAYKVWD